MNGLRQIVRLVGAIVASAAVSGAGLFATPARAGTYAVVACRAAAGNVNHAWALTNNDPVPPSTGTVVAVQACGSSGEDGGLSLSERLGSGPDPTEISFGYYELVAPAGTSITAIAYDRFMDRYNDDGAWRQELRDGSGGAIESCNAAPDCSLGHQGGGPADSFTISGGTDRLRFGIWCVPLSSMSGCDNGATLHRAHVVLYGSTVTISDPTGPTGATLSGVPTGWTDGAFSPQVSGSDNIALASRRVVVDGRQVGRADAACDYTYTVPCPPSASGAVGLDFGALADGTYPITGVIYDAGGMTATSGGQTLRLDRHAPAAPTATLAGPALTRADTAPLTVSTSEAQAAPITAVVTQLCDRDSSQCDDARQVAVDGTSTTVAVPVGRDGNFLVRTWLRDAAGNSLAPDITRSTDVTFSRDATPPQVEVFTSVAGVVAPGTVVGTAYRAADAARASGVDAGTVQLSVDGGAFSGISGSFTVQSGHRYVVQAQARDRAGNLGTSAPIAIEGASAGPGTPPTRTSAKLTVSSARRATRGAIRVTGRAAPIANGATVTARLTLRDPRTRRITRLAKRATIRGGRFAVTLALPSRVRSAKALSGRRVVVTLAQTQTLAGARVSRRVVPG